MAPTAGPIVCVPCRRFMRCVKNGVTVEELLQDGEPYRLWDADMWECPSCRARAILGFGRGPLAEHYEPTYEQQRLRLTPVIQAR